VFEFETGPVCEFKTGPHGTAALMQARPRGARPVCEILLDTHSHSRRTKGSGAPRNRFVYNLRSFYLANLGIEAANFHKQ